MRNNIGQKLGKVGIGIGAVIIGLLMFAAVIAVPTFGFYLYDHGLSASVRHVTDRILNTMTDFYVWGMAVALIAIFIIGAGRGRRG